jgi:RNA polymerase sigma-70 factor (ECF subfamily)
LSAVAPTLLHSGPRPRPAEATRLLYERHSSRIFGYCLSLLGSREEAEDAVQTTFMNVQRGLDRGVIPQYELAWLFKIARNVCYNRSESSSRRRRVESAHDLDNLEEVLASPDRSAGVSIGELTHALGAIPERQRRALLLREFQGMSYEEIAGELSVSVAAVETLLFRARRSLADQLEQAGMPRRRGAVASVVALFRWFFDGSAVPVKLGAVTAAVATTATLAVAPVFRSDPAGPVHVIPTVVAPVAHAKTPVKVRGVPERATRSTSSHGAQTVHGSPATAAVQGETQTGSSAPAPSGRDLQPVEGQHATDTSTPTASTPPPALTTPVTVPSVQDVTDVLPVPTPQISVPTVTLPDVDLPVDVPQPKLP